MLTIRRTARSCPTTFPSSCRSKSSTSELRISGSNNPSVEMYGLTIAGTSFAPSGHLSSFDVPCANLTIGRRCRGLGRQADLGSLARFFYGLQVELLVVTNYLRRTEVPQGVPAGCLSHLIPEIGVPDELEACFCHSCHVAQPQHESV